jgi:hypothetical protein
MNRCGCVCSFVIVLVTSVFTSAPMALGDQARPPARIANIYGGRNHQPTRSEVEQRERAAGIQPDPARESADDAAVGRLFDELTQKARAG